MGEHRVTRVGIGVLAACIVAIALVAPSVATAAKRPATEQIVYRSANVGGERTTVYDRGGLRLEAGCDGTASLNFSDRRGPGRFVLTSLFSSREDFSTEPVSSQIEWNELDFNLSAPKSTQIFEAMVQDDGSIFSVEGVIASPGFGRRCSFTGLVTRVPEAQQVGVSADEGDSQTFSPQGPLAYEFGCDTGVSLASQTALAPNVFGRDHLDADEWLGEVGELLGQTPVVSGAPGGTIFNGMFTPASGRLGLMRLAMMQGIDDPGCSAFGFTQSVDEGASRVFYAKNPTDSTQRRRERKEILNLGGLQLLARCDPGQARIYVASKRPHAMLAFSSFGDRPPIDYYDRDFSAVPGQAAFLLDLEGVERTGQLIYARRNGRVVSLRFTGWGGTSEFKECGFSGIARTG